MGYLASAKGSLEKNLRQAIIHGTVTASYCCEGFGLNRTIRITRADIGRRVRELFKIAAW